jgi:hypothetical protein
VRSSPLDVEPSAVVDEAPEEPDDDRETQLLVENDKVEIEVDELETPELLPRVVDDPPPPVGPLSKDTDALIEPSCVVEVVPDIPLVLPYP